MTNSTRAGADPVRVFFRKGAVIVPTLSDALAYMGIDYADDMVTANVTRALATAVQVLHGAVGEDVETYLPGDPRAAELVLIYTDDLYSERGVAAKVSGAPRRLVADMELQLRLELRREREKAQALESGEAL